MSVDDPDDLDRVDREIRANEHRARAEDDNEQPWPDDDEDEDDEEEEQEFPSAGVVKGSHFTTLTDAGIELPDPEELNDAAVTAKLWEVIHELAERQVFLVHTDHLSDRELYNYLWSEALHEFIPYVPFDDMVCTIDLVGSGSEEHIDLYHRFYAGEDERRDWHEQFPEDEMPPREKPPHDRDRRLPKHRWDTPPDEKED